MLQINNWHVNNMEENWWGGGSTEFMLFNHQWLLIIVYTYWVFSILLEKYIYERMGWGWCCWRVIIRDSNDVAPVNWLVGEVHSYHSTHWRMQTSCHFFEFQSEDWSPSRIIGHWLFGVWTKPLKQELEILTPSVSLGPLGDDCLFPFRLVEWSSIQVYSCLS